MSEISIIIPTYNCAKYISEAIESVLAQTYKDYEIIVVNDGSTDNAETIIKNIFKKLKEVGECKYIYQENQGSANARNRAIKESEGEYIAWLDQDDIWLPNRL
ncbi:glycosyltransferase family 2 protein, partial [Desulfonauticus submarinus]